MITLAGVIPDIDGLGIIPELLTRHSEHPLLWFSDYHHQLHNLAFGLLVTAVAFGLAKQKWKTGLLVLLSFHLHLFEDLIGARGPDGDQWPIPYLWPFSHGGGLTWSGQWALNAWPNFAITIGIAFGHFLPRMGRGDIRHSRWFRRALIRPSLQLCGGDFHERRNDIGAMGPNCGRV